MMKSREPTADLFAQLCGLKILKDIQYSCDFQTFIWAKISRCLLSQFHHRFLKVWNKNQSKTSLYEFIPM